MIIDPKDLPNIRSRHYNQRIILCTGSFDLTHAGHILFLEDSKKLGDILIVGVGSDAIIKYNKGEGRPILNEYLRVKMISSLKPVDYAYIDTLGEFNVPLSSLDVALSILRPDIYAVNSDGFNMDLRRGIIDKYKVEMVIMERKCPDQYDNISSTKIIQKILKSI